MSRKVLLLSPPGAGKSRMAMNTAVNRPVHVLDLDRKVRSMNPPSDVTWWELKETLVEGGLVARAKSIANDTKPTLQPMGWIRICEMIERLPKDEQSKNAGTWVLDSLSVFCDHLIRFILFSSPKAKAHMSQREWGAFLQMMKESMSVLIDGAQEHDKDLIVTVHERLVERPGPSTKILYDGDERNFVGPVEWVMAPSIGGQFATEVTRYFEEVYALFVKPGDKPQWLCRVHPDGKRDLRTTFDTKGKVEFPPDFKQIWK